MDNTHKFILNHWEETIRDPSFNNKTYLPNKYMTPCGDDTFQNFYYWDTYFINVGLIADNDITMARNHLNIMKYFINKIGFVPNADHLVYGSQPPLFTRAIFDLYSATKDINDIKNYINEAIKEMSFWRENRNTKIGLNQYKCGFPKQLCIDNHSYFNDRVGGFNQIELSLGKQEMTENCYAIAESGWDMNSRYLSNGNRFAALNFANVDLNSILFDAEMKISQMLDIINEKELSVKYLHFANERKKLMDKYMLTSDGLYLDYDFINDKHSHLLTVASLYPYAFGISNDKENCLKIFSLLKQKHGISSSVKMENAIYQWDYPNMWPPVVYFSYLALKNVKLEEEANWLKKEYLNVVDSVYKKTGSLWEKYDSITGEVAYNDEYHTPTMLGWTAGIYEYFYKAR